MLAALAVAVLLAAEPEAATRAVTLKIVREGSKPVPNLDVMLCPHPRDAQSKCYEAATTDARGIATFQRAPLAVVSVHAISDCGLGYPPLDLRPPKLPKPLVVETPPTGTVRVKLLEHRAGGEPRPLRVSSATVTLRPRPPLQSGAGLRQIMRTSPQPTDRFDLCAEPGRAYDVEVQGPGFYLGSAPAITVEASRVVEVPITVRRKSVP